MSEQPCDRCGRKERIPTDQGIKFYDENSYFCGTCFSEYNQLMNEGRHGGARAGKPSHLEIKIQGECGRCGETTEEVPEDNTVKSLRTLVEHYLCDDDWYLLKNWYCHPTIPTTDTTPTRPPTRTQPLPPASFPPTTLRPYKRTP